MSHTNRTSSIRSGFAYQNFWGLRLCGEWLIAPEKYKWIQFETCPDEEDPSKFYLDDIVCLDSDDFYHFYQTKHRQDPANKWTWNSLLNTERSGGTSLIKKWANSLATRLDKTKEAFFITNGEAEDDITKYLSNELVDIQRIKTETLDLYNRIIVEIGNEDNAVRIFQTLHFRFNQENLSGDDLEATIRKSFYENLSATESGVTNLYHEIDKECRQQNTRQLDIETLRRWCEFDLPRPLEEQFDIPADFEFLDDHTHQSILSDLQKPEGGIKVIFGKPGVGKSVYLSKLDKELSEKKLISIKHHYHISPEDSNPQERLNAERVIEAIKSQLKSHKEELGDLANKNSKEIPVGEFITTIATKLNSESKSLIVIIDGLDHVLRYGEKNELESFLKEICLPQPGVWIIIGMQAVAKPHLPQIVFDKCPETKWTEIKGLSKDAVSKLIQANKIGLHLPDQAEQFKNLVEKLFSITEGNPLHLRYSLQQLKNISGNSLVTDYSCNDLISYGAGIEKYYDSLWNQISDKAKELLLAMASVNFLFTERQLIECISFSTTSPEDVTNGFKQISHLISKNLRDQMSVYHNSFELFLRDRPEMTQQRIVIKTNIKKWLEQSSHEYLKWAELRIIEHELGNSNPILEIDREWLINAICYPSNSSQISKQMKLAARVACEKEDFGKGLQISYLHTYYLNSKDFVEEATELVWKEALQRNPNVFDYLDFESLPSTLLPELASTANATGKDMVVEEINEILIERLSRQEYRQNSIPSATAALLNVLPYDRTHKTENIYKYIIQFRDLNITQFLFGIYSRQLFALGQKEKITKLFELDLTGTEKQAVLVECARYGFKNKGDDISTYLNSSPDLPLICSLFKAIKGSQFDLPLLPEYDIFPDKIREHDSEERAKWRGFYYDNFLIGILYGIAGKQKDVEEWIVKAPSSWSARAMTGLFRASLYVSTGIRESKINYGALFSYWADLDILKWHEDRDILGLQSAFSDSVKAILEDIIVLKEYFGNGQEITLADYVAITKNPPFFSKSDLTSLTLEAYQPLLARDVYEKIKNEDIDVLSKTVNYFPDRARDYSTISKITRLYGETELSHSLLKKASDNLLGYGYHKDTYLFDVLEAIEFCAKSGIEKTKIDDWTSRIIPLIESVGEYTDGDETNHLPYELADLLATQDQALLRKYYYHSADKEELYHAEDLFKYVIKSLSFSKEEAIALASTAVEKDAFLELKTIAQSNPDASTALEKIQSYLGQINFPTEKGSSYTGIEKPTQDYSKIDPEHLLEHLDTNFENRWEWNNYLIGWIGYWLDKSGKEKIYNTLKQIIDKFGVQAISGELLDTLYPLAFEFDNGTAFDMLCKAQINDHGWQRYWTDKKKAEKRWQFIKEKYPRRYLEFFQKSTDYHVPLSRGVEYLLLFGDSAKAESITEASVCFAKSLVTDSNIPLPEWSESRSEVNILDILIQRLIWPSPLVRERAATALAYLLCSSTKKEDVLKILLSWIEEQRLETAVAIGFLPIIKAFSIIGNPNDLKYIDIKTLAKAVSINSEVIEKLFDELTLLTTQDKPELPSPIDIELVPTGYSSNPFFAKYIKTFLAPIYMQRAEEIERRSRKQFIQQWVFTADNIIRDTGIQLNSNQVYYYARSEHDEFLLGFSSKISEVYRSAFLRVLQHFYQNGDIPKDFYLEYAYATLPIELSKWKILLNRAPDWWPKLAPISTLDTKKDDPLTTIYFENSPEDLIKNSDGKVLVAAEGAIQTANGWVDDPMHSFLLVAFGYKVVGSEMPTPEEVAEEIAYSPTLVTIPSRTNRPFNFLEDRENHLPVGSEGIRIKDIVIYPIVARDRDLCIALWQYFRDYDMAFNLNHSLSQELKIELGKNKWQLKNKDERIVATYEDWLEGLKERYDRNMPLPHGQSLTLDQDFLNSWLSGDNLRLGYLLKSTYRSRQYSHDEVKKYKETKLLNVSNIII